MRKKIKVGLVGQPNVGKSTLFNTITKGNVIVTNWPGTTVEKHEGYINYKGYEIVIADLPGIYGLSYLTLEERITRKFIIEEEPDVVVVLVDSLNIERTLYLAIELRELVENVVIAITKIDEAHSRGIHINYELLEKKLNTPVVPVSALKKFGIERLLDIVVRYVSERRPLLRIDYGELEPFLNSLEQVLQEYSQSLEYPTRWLAVRYLEGDVEVEDIVRKILGDSYRELEEIREEAKRRIGIDISAFTSMKRVSYIQELVRNVVVKHRITKREPKINYLLYNPYVAPIISFSFTLAIFLIVFIINTGYPLSTLFTYLGYKDLSNVVEEYSLSNLVKKLFEYIGNIIINTLGKRVLTSFLVEGVLGGVSSVLIFIPLIVIVMAVLGALEDSGLLPRIAIGTHLLFQKAGLSGHSLLPITLSLGCNVPGVTATRAIPNYLERVKLILLTPFIPCQARLIVLLAIATGVKGFVGAVLIPLSYFVAFTIFILFSYIMNLIFKKKKQYIDLELLLEIPPLHKPHPIVVWWFIWFYLKHFLAKAGTIIFSISVVSWLLLHISVDGFYTEDIVSSIAVQVSKYLTPLLSLFGISGENAWVIAYAIIMGFIAKELVVSAIMLATSSTTFEEAFQKLCLSIPSTISFALFTTLYIPCIATLATIYSETKSFKYVLTSIILMTVTAYVMSLSSYTLIEWLLGAC